MVEFGFTMGPYEAQDLTGLDIADANRRRQHASRDPNRRHIPIVGRMLELGKLGRQAGERKSVVSGQEGRRGGGADISRTTEG